MDRFHHASLVAGLFLLAMTQSGDKIVVLWQCKEWRSAFAE